MQVKPFAQTIEFMPYCLFPRGLSELTLFFYKRIYVFDTIINFSMIRVQDRSLGVDQWTGIITRRPVESLVVERIEIGKKLIEVVLGYRIEFVIVALGASHG